MPQARQNGATPAPRPPSLFPDTAWMGYGVAVAAVAAATLLTLALFQVVGVAGVRVVFVFYFAAVFLSTWRGGIRPGLLSILLTVVIADYYFFQPYTFLSFDSLEVLQISLFAGVALLIIYLTERGRRAEEEAQKSEESLATTLRSIGDAVIATDAHGRVTFMNPVAQKLTGWTTEEARGRALPEVFHIINEESREVVENPVEKVIREGTIVGLANHTLLITKLGAEIPIEDSGAPIRDAHGRITGIVLVFHDTTERRRSEEVIKQRERELTDFIENATVGLHWVGGDGTILWANRAELEMLGYTPEEYIGHNINDFHADPEVIEDILKRLSNREALHDYEARLRAKDGSIRHVMISSNVMWGNDDKFVHTRCFTRDITERKRVEEMSFTMAAIVESSDDAIIGKTLDGTITSWNVAAQKLYGYTDEEAIGKPISLIIPPELADQLVSILDRISRGEKVEHLDTVRVKKDGTRVEVSVTISPIRNASGRIIGASAIARDITERKQSEEALRRSEARNRALLYAIPDLMLRIRKDGTLLDVNAPMDEDLIAPSEEFLGRNLHDVLPPDVTRQTLHYMSRALETGAAQVFEYKLGLPGKEKTFEARVVAAADDEVVSIIRNITARRRAEEDQVRFSTQIEIERRRLRDLVGNVPGVVWEAWGVPDASSQRIDFVSNYVEQMLGYSVEEWLATPNFWLTIVHPEDRERAAHEAHALFESKREGTSQFRWVAKDGRIVPVEAQSAVILDEEGNPVGMRGVTMDITARMRAEEELRESEYRYRALADAMPQIVWTGRADGYFDYYNRRWFEYTGMTFEQTQGWGWQPAIHPDDVEQALRRWARSVQTGEPYLIEYRFRRATDGQYRWHLGRAEPLRDAEGRIVKWFGTATDIHGQKQAEEALRSLAEAGAMLASSLDFETTLARLAHLSVTSLADYCLIDVVEDGGKPRRVAAAHADRSKEELVRKLRRFPPAPDKAEGVPKVLRTGKPEIAARVSDEKLSALTQSDEHKEILRSLGLKSFMIVPLITRERIIGAITFALTASERAYGDEDLAFAEELARRAALAIDNAQLYGRAQEVNRAKDEFLATLSHELRTPLTPIIGWVHMIRSGRISAADVTQGISVIDKNSQSLARLINDLLDMSSILSGKMRIERAPVALGAVVREAVETVRPEADKNGIHLEVSKCDDAGVSGDRTRLIQVFWNLLTNAVKFSDAGGRVRVECRAVDAHAQVSVTDEGHGIVPEFLPHVFERFRQADGSTTRLHGGLGIGLALVKSFVEAHGGTVDVDSPGEGHGSRFTVTLPLAHAPAMHHHIVDEPAPEDAQLGPGETYRVLIVEDARDTLDMLQVVFEARGYETTLCESAEEALRVAHGVWFDIIVSDIGLPQIDGYELIKRLRRIPHLRDVAALALTGYAAPKDAESALAAGFDAHIAKPVDPALLAAEVEQLLRRKPRHEEPEA